MVIIIPILLILIFLEIYFLSRYNIKKLQTYISPIFGKIVVWEKHNGEKILTINGFSQGISINEPSVKKSYWYAIGQSVLEVCVNKKNPKVLILGLGGNTTSLLIQKENPNVYFTIVEIEKYIIEACRKYFNLDQLKNLNLINEDVYKVIYKTKEIHAPFDAIIIDIFNGKSSKIKTREESVIDQLIKILKPKGALIFNWPANTERTKKETEKIVNYCKEKGLKVNKEFVNDPRKYQNFVITAQHD